MAVSERDFPHARCGLTHAVNKSRISPSDHFTNVGVGFRFKQEVGVDGVSTTAAYV